MKQGWILTAALAGTMAAGITALGQVAPATRPAGDATAPAPIPGLGFTETTPEMLGPQFMSQAAGISLRPPAGVKTVRRVSGDTVVEFVNDEKKWVLRVTRTVLTKPMKLSVPSQPGQNGDRGMLELSVETLQGKLPNNKVLRQDVIPLAKHDAGMTIMRAAIGPQDQFIQQAIIQANEQLYYTIYMSAPGQAASTPADAPPKPGETEAASVFRAVLDSVEILDQEKLRAEQDDRLFKTRSLFLNWNEAKIRSVLIPEQWMRVMKDGKDVGYSYIVEEPETRGTSPGIKIGIRSRMVLPPPLIQLDGEVWYHVSFDRRSEAWSSLSLFTEAKDRYLVSEFGTSSQRRKPVPDKTALGTEGIDPRNPGIKLIDTYTLSVHRKTKDVTAPPIDRDLPPYYIPQAIGHLLPRLLPLGEQRGYLFACWVANEAEVKLRYVDVGKQKEVTFGGQKLQVIPVTDRLGYDGAPTVHFMTMSGKYLGSESTSLDANGTRTVLTVMPTDAATLTGLWRNADLSAPGDKAEPAPADDKK
jgi:hypothetical protein